MALTTSINFPPPPNAAPYAIDREWCMGDSLGIINANFAHFDNRFNNLSIIKGLTYSYATTTTLIVAPGFCVSSNNATPITNSNNLTLNIQNVGINGLQNSVTPNTPYYLFIIYNPSTTTTASFASINSVPTLPSGFTDYRLIGTFSTKSDNTIRNFFQKGEYNNRKLFFNDTVGLVTDGIYGFSPNNLVFQGTNREPVAPGSGIALGYTINLSSLLLRNNFIQSVFIGYQGLSVSGLETAYRIGARFTGTNGYMVASCNYNGVSNGQYDIQGELPVNMSNINGNNLEIWYSRNDGSNYKQDYISVYCHGLVFEV